MFLKIQDWKVVCCHNISNIARFRAERPCFNKFNSVACSTAKRKASYSANRDKTFC